MHKSEGEQHLGCIGDEQDDELAVCCHVKNLAQGSILLAEATCAGLSFRGRALSEANRYLDVAAGLLQ